MNDSKLSSLVTRCSLLGLRGLDLVAGAAHLAGGRYLSLYIYIYIYIYTQRERERDIEIEIERER